MPHTFTEQWKQVWKQAGVGYVGREKEVARLRELMHQPNAIISVSGMPGTGKTTLIHAAASGEEFPGGVYYLHAFEGLNAEELRGMEGGPGPILFIIDDADSAPAEVRDRLVQFSKSRGPDVRVVLASRQPVASAQYSLDLLALTTDQLIALWAADGLNLNPAETQSLAKATAGNPAIAKVLSELIRGGHVSAEHAAQLVSSFTASGLYGPNAEPLVQGSLIHREVTAQLVVASDEVLRQLDAQPESVFRLTPREFEELVAELLTRQGFDVELTSATRDGGKDLYALKKSGLGTALYVAECKRYAPHRRVGIEVVQRLHGVVQAEKLTGGLVVTTSTFSRDAAKWQETVRYQMSLANYVELRAWISDAIHRDASHMRANEY